MRFHLTGILMLAVFLGGCVNEPIVDKRGVNPVQYDTDLAECRTFAEEVNTPGEVARRGAIGAAVGGALGAVFGNSSSVGKGAGGGAIIGGTRGADRAGQRKERVLFNCMKGRGYRVLG
jgi:outer membrane lipoprotein SlyB